MDIEKTTIGGGCFWCIEAVYERIDGVISAVSGYASGDIPNPTYHDVSTGKSGYAEVVQIEFDKNKITYSEILELFWGAHNPTTLNRQGADIGTQYRSIILYHNEDQKKIAQESIKKANKKYENKIVTLLEPLDNFYIAEDYHQDYYEKNPYAGYCTYVIRPKLEKMGLDWHSLK